MVFRTNAIALIFLLQITSLDLNGSSSSPSSSSMHNRPAAVRASRKRQIAANARLAFAMETEEIEQEQHKTLRLSMAPQPPTCSPSRHDKWSSSSSPPIKRIISGRKQFRDNKDMILKLLENGDYQFLCKVLRVSKGWYGLVSQLLLPTAPKLLPGDSLTLGKTQSVGQQWAILVHKIFSKAKTFEQGVNEIAALVTRCQNPFEVLRTVLRDYFTDIPSTKRFWDRASRSPIRVNKELEKEREELAILYAQKIKLEKEKAEFVIRPHASEYSRISTELEQLNNRYTELVTHLMDCVTMMQPYALAEKILCLVGSDQDLFKLVDTASPDLIIQWLMHNDKSTELQAQDFVLRLTLDEAFENRMPTMYSSLSALLNSPYSTITKNDKRALEKDLAQIQNWPHTDWIHDMRADTTSSPFMGLGAPITAQTIEHEKLLIKRYSRRIRDLFRSLLVRGCNQELSAVHRKAQNAFSTFLADRYKIYNTCDKESLDPAIRPLVAARPEEIVTEGLNGGCRALDLYQSIAEIPVQDISNNPQKVTLLRRAILYGEKALAELKKRHEPFLDLLQRLSQYYKLLAVSHDQLTNLTKAEQYLTQFAETREFQQIHSYELLADIRLTLARMHFEAAAEIEESDIEAHKINSAEAIKYCKDTIDALGDARLLFDDKYVMLNESAAKEMRNAAKAIAAEYPAAKPVADYTAEYLKVVRRRIAEIEFAATQQASQSSSSSATNPSSLIRSWNYYSAIRKSNHKKM